MREPPPPHQLSEIAEDAASGTIARIYEEIRVYCGVPYVSSLHRYLASLPGVLEFAWGALRPAFLDGSLPETAWRLVAELPGRPHPPLSPAALRLLGVDRESTNRIRAICEGFIRVAPVNLLFAGCLERLLGGAKPGGSGTGPRQLWQPPSMLPPLPPLVEATAAPEHLNTVLSQLGTEIDGKPFVPGLYRLLAHWPAYLAHVATLIGPELDSATARAERAAMAGRIIAAADGILKRLPPLPGEIPLPGADQTHVVLRAIRSYRVTSPEMIVFATRLRDALPA